MEEKLQVSETKESNQSTMSVPIILQQAGAEVDKIINQAEKIVDMLVKIKTLSVRLTNKEDWINQNGQPYLEWTGASKIRQAFGVSIKDKQKTIEKFTDDNGEYIIVTMTGKAEYMGKEIEGIGVCSSRDKFFGREHGQLKDLEEIALENIIRKADTNLNQRLLKSILGLSFTWEDLENNGIKQNNVGKVEYERTINEEDVEKQKQITRILKEMLANDETKMKSFLISVTKYSYKDKETGNTKDVAGVESTKVLSGKRLQVTLEKVLKEYNTWLKTQPSENDRKADAEQKF